jgi:hypothetical protein
VNYLTAWARAKLAAREHAVPRSVRLYSVLSAAVLVSLSCRDTTSPVTGSQLKPTAAIAAAALPGDGDLVALESPATGSGHMTIQPSGIYDDWPILGDFPTTTVVSAEISGTATAAPWTVPWIFTEKGYAGLCNGYIPAIGGQQGQWTACGPSAYIKVLGQPKLLVGQLPTPAGCGQYPNPPCPNFTGGFDAKITRIGAALDLSPTDTTFLGGTAAVIRWHATPDSVGGFKTPLIAKRVFFAPDSGEVEDDSTLGCETTSDGYYYQSNYCRIAPQGSGTLHVWAIVNGKLEHKTARITAPQLMLEADPPSGASPTTVTFTPKWSDGTAVTQAPNWSWAPDSLPGANVACAWASNRHSCTTDVVASGTMSATITINGKSRVAKTHVSIIPCPLSDPVLNDRAIRTALRSLLERSNPDSAPGAGIDPPDMYSGVKKERTGAIYQRPDHSYYFVEDTAAVHTATECHSVSSYDEKRGDDILVAGVHVHPTHELDANDPMGLGKIYGCRDTQTAPGEIDRYQRWPGDTVDGRLLPYVRNRFDAGGGSSADWASGGGKRDSYVLSAEGEIWRLPKEMYGKPDSIQATNRDFHPIKNNTVAACNW